MFSKKLLPTVRYYNVTLYDTVFSILSFIINRVLRPSSFFAQEISQGVGKKPYLGNIPDHENMAMWRC